MKLFRFSLFITIACFLSIYLFTRESCNEVWELSTNDKGLIGDAIGGITAPIIGIATAILLFITLQRQIDSNETNYIFQLINQLENDINSFYLVSKNDDDEITKLIGVEGILEYSQLVTFLVKNEEIEDIRLGKLQGTLHLILIIKSYEIVKSEINKSNLAISKKRLLNSKLQLIYSCYLKIPIRIIVEQITTKKELKDEAYQELSDFYDSQDNSQYNYF